MALYRLIASTLAVVVIGCGSKDQPAPAASAADGGAAAPKAPGRTIDLTDNAEVEKLAIDCLQAYKDKNLEKLASLGPPGAKEKLIFIEPRNPHYQELLGDDTWRMKSLKAWDGKTLAKVERGIDVAFAWYGQDDTSKYGVELRKDNDRWSFHDLVQKPLAGK
ncbi:MAG: hypothetical protein U1F43_12295 [Myxococcota bacterium]